MTTVSFSEGNNVGGIRSLLMTLFYYLNTYHPPTFKPGYDWTEMEFLPDSAQCDHTETPTDHGIEYSYKLTFGFNRQDVVKYVAFGRYLGNTGICKFTDNNGLTRILGTASNRITVATKGSTGDDAKTANYYNITITWLSDKPAQVV